MTSELQLDEATSFSHPATMAAAEEGLLVLNPDRPKIVHWDDLQQELARLCSLSSALQNARNYKDSLALKLQSLVKLREESVRQTNELEEMRQKLDERKLAMGDLLLRTKKASGDSRSRREELVYELRFLLIVSKKITTANHRLQEAKVLLAGEGGCGHLQCLRRVLRTRQQHMVSQVLALYPVKASIPHSGGETDSKSRDFKKSVSLDDSKSQLSSLTILGLQATAFPIRKSGFFIDKKEAQRSASALGYVAHAASLIASYLDVPLRYPIRLGGSKSYMHDYAHSSESTISDSTSDAITSAVLRPIEFPLFLEGQDSTRAAYAVFLLNKDLEQLLNYIGSQSLGPRHVLANLRELVRVALSNAYVDR